MLGIHHNACDTYTDMLGRTLMITVQWCKTCLYTGRTSPLPSYDRKYLSGLLGRETGPRVRARGTVAFITEDREYIIYGKAAQCNKIYP